MRLALRVANAWLIPWRRSARFFAQSSPADGPDGPAAESPVVEAKAGALAGGSTDVAPMLAQGWSLNAGRPSAPTQR